MTADEARARIRALLRECTTLVLATSDARGVPDATPLFYWADDDLKLYWLSSRDSAHSRNLARNRAVAAGVYPPVADWRAIRGLQIRGTAGLALDRDRVLENYRQRFGLGPELDGAIEESAVYELRPDWIRYLDNALGFGFKAEIEI